MASCSDATATTTGGSSVRRSLRTSAARPMCGTGMSVAPAERERGTRGEIRVTPPRQHQDRPERRTVMTHAADMQVEQAPNRPDVHKPVKGAARSEHRIVKHAAQRPAKPQIERNGKPPLSAGGGSWRKQIA